MKRKRNVILAGLLAVVALVVTACDVADKPATSWQTNAGTNPGNDPTNVYATARIGNVVVLGGNFNRVYSPDRRQSVGSGGLAALDAGTGAFKWTANAGGTVYKIVADGNVLWVAGSFGLKKYDANGRLNASWRPAANLVGTVRGALTVGPDAVYLAGSSGVMAINKSNAHTIWRTPTAGGQVWTLSYARNNAGARIVAGGYFCTVGAAKVARPGLASFGTNGAVDTRFNATAFGCKGTPGNLFDTARSVLSSVAYNTTVYVGGGGSLNQAAQVDMNTGRVIWASTRGDGDVQSVAIQGSYLYIGGHFDCIAGNSPTKCSIKRQKAARFQLSNNALSNNWAPDFRGGFNGVWSMTGDTSALYVGGNFTSVNGQVPQKFTIVRP